MYELTERTPFLEAALNTEPKGSPQPLDEAVREGRQQRVVDLHFFFLFFFKFFLNFFSSFFKREMP